MILSDPISLWFITIEWNISILIDTISSLLIILFIWWSGEFHWIEDSPSKWPLISHPPSILIKIYDQRSERNSSVLEFYFGSVLVRMTRWISNFNKQPRRGPRSQVLMIEMETNPKQQQQVKVDLWNRWRMTCWKLSFGSMFSIWHPFLFIWYSCPSALLFSLFEKVKHPHAPYLMSSSSFHYYYPRPSPACRSNSEI